MSEFHHISVLLDECIEGLNIKPDGIYVDGTLGGAGHSLQIARRLTTGRLIGIDRDPVALNAARQRLKECEERVTLVHSNFCYIDQVLEDLGIDGVDGVLLDLGVSSPQLDDGSRGFSYMVDAPLDMRMNSQDALSAYEIVNEWSYEELRRILYDYGEERYAPQIVTPCRQRWNWWTSSVPPCRQARCGRSSIRPSEAFRPFALRSTMNLALSVR